jgi:hypothetical protein
MSSQGEYITRLDPFLFHDAARHVEYQRRMSLMIAASGIIDLTEVSFVRRSFADTVDDQSSMDSHIPIMTEPLRPTRSNQKPHLEIIMENGLQLKFGVKETLNYIFPLADIF